MAIYLSILAVCFFIAVLMAKRSDQSAEPLGWFWAKLIGEIVFYWEYKTYRAYASRYGDPSLVLVFRSVVIVLNNLVRWILVFYCFGMMAEEKINQHWLFLPVSFAVVWLICITRSISSDDTKTSIVDNAVLVYVIELFILTTAVFQMLDSARPGFMYFRGDDHTFLWTLFLSFCLSSTLGKLREI